MIIPIAFSVTCDITGVQFDGSFDNPQDAINAAITAGWVQVGRLMFCPQVALPIQDQITASKLNVKKGGSVANSQS